jgi:hypothetical protein
MGLPLFAKGKCLDFAVSSEMTFRRNNRPTPIVLYALNQYILVRDFCPVMTGWEGTKGANIAFVGTKSTLRTLPSRSHRIASIVPFRSI